MTYPIYQVDAFTDTLFAGNPAAVMPLEAWLDDALLQAIAAENNLSETAFFLPQADGFALRWFTPKVEVDLCGHATLAAAHVLYEHLGYEGNRIRFHTRSGQLAVMCSDDGLTLDLPARTVEPVEVDLAICDALGAVASEAIAPAGEAGPLLCVYEFESDVAALAPDFAALAAASERNVIASAPGDSRDVVSRFFAPRVGIDEDAVTGSAHCVLVPYWARRLGRDSMACRQISPRGGELDCTLRGDRVMMTGRAVTYLVGEVRVR
jgi:PhzF family phenazine biosynthesis protein